MKKKEAKNLGIMFLILLVGSFGLSFGIGIMIGLLGMEPTWWGVSTALEAGQVLICMLWLSRQGIDLLDTIGFRRIKGTTILLTLGLVCCIHPVATFVNLLSQLFVPNTVTQTSTQMIGSSFMVMLIATAFVPAFCEEIIYRGFFFHRYKKATGLRMAILVSALIFGFLHMNLNQFCYATVLGIFFALANEASGSIFTSILMHAVFNGYSVVMIYLVNLAAVQENVDIVQEAEASRNIAELTPYLVRYAILGLVGMKFAITCYKAIAKNEGNLDHFLSIFTKQESMPEQTEKQIEEQTEEEQSEETSDKDQVVNVWFIAAVVLSVLLMFLDV